jgi:hypothetical protein
MFELAHQPPDWVLFEAAKRSGWDKWRADHLLRCYVSEHPDYVSEHPDYGSYRALCDMIERYEKPPPDRKVLCARKAASEHGYDEWDEAVDACRRAIELWEEEFGK